MSKNTDSLISIIIPVYKVEKFLDRCIESLINQEYKNLEIILVDDGSPDNCPKMCDEWSKKDDRIKVVHKENGGVGSARNEGIKIACGDYITFVDSDDWVTEDFSKALDLINQHAECDMFSFGYYKSNKLLNSFDNLEFDLQNNDEFTNYYSMKQVIICCNRIIKSKIIKENDVLFGTNGKGQDMGEDFEWAFRVSTKCGKTLMTDIAYYIYFVNDESATQTFNIKKIQAHIENMRSVSNVLNEKGLTKKQKQSICSNIFEVNYGFLKVASRLSKEDRKVFIGLYKANKLLFHKPRAMKLKLVWLLLKIFGIKFTMFCLRFI